MIIVENSIKIWSSYGKYIRPRFLTIIMFGMPIINAKVSFSVDHIANHMPMKM